MSFLLNAIYAYCDLCMLLLVFLCNFSSNVIFHCDVVNSISKHNRFYSFVYYNEQSFIFNICSIFIDLLYVLFIYMYFLFNNNLLIFNLKLIAFLFLDSYILKYYNLFRQ